LRDCCPAYGQDLVERKESARVSFLMLELNNQVNASPVDPAFKIAQHITSGSSQAGIRTQQAKAWIPAERQPG